MSDNSKPTVVLVDDEREILRALTRGLKRDPYTLLAFHNPLRAVELLSRQSVSVIVSDIEMPQMSGLQLMRQARLTNPGAARIILSGVSSMDAAIEAINQGAVHRFLRKPFDLAVLRGAIERGLSESRARSEVAEQRRKGQALELWRERMRRECPHLLDLELDDSGAYRLDASGAADRARALGLEHLVRFAADRGSEKR